MSASASVSSAFTSYASPGPVPLTTPLLHRYAVPNAVCEAQVSLWEVRPASPVAAQSESVITAAPQLWFGCTLEIATNGAPIVYSPGVCPGGYTPASTLGSGSQSAYTSLCCYEGLTLLSTGPWRSSCGNLMQSRNQIIYISYSDNVNSNVLIKTSVDKFFLVDTPYTVAWASSGKFYWVEYLCDVCMF